MKIKSKGIIGAAIIVGMAMALPALSKSPKPSSEPPAPPAVQIDAEKRLEAILPAGWNIEENEPSPPLMWRGSKSCRHFTITNGNERLSVEQNNFDYNPFHDMWLCPSDFWGKMEKTDASQQKFAARYIADGEDGILFTISLGSRDWVDPAGTAATALGLAKPAYDPVECERIMNAVSGKVYLPEIMLLECRSTTTDAIFLSLTTDVQMREIEVDKLTLQVIDTVKKTIPGKKRVVVSRTYSNKIDSVISAYCATF